ncbi:MAG: PD-(D/E)XK nuclease family protein [Deltaproteobacteria bacterium]|jgi:hypothetical protein|nr:PD-(D/E)XK nuclease family protein [Deltaproteobacteria bacterium]
MQCPPEELPAALETVFDQSMLYVVPSEPVLAEFRDSVLARSSRGVVLMPRVLTMRSLERELLRELGRRPADPWAGRLHMERLAEGLFPALELPEPPGPELASELAGELADGIGRIRQAGIGWGEVEAMSPPGLARTVAELGRRHEEWLAERHEDDAEGLRRGLLEALRAGRGFRTLAGLAEVRLLHFQRLSPFEADLVKALAVRCRVHLTLEGPGWLSDKVERVRAGVLRKLLIEDLETAGRGGEAGLRLDFSDVSTGGNEPTVFREPEIPPALRYAAGNLFGPPPAGPAPPPEGRLRVIRAPSPYMECESALRIAKSLVVEGLDPSRAAVVVPSLRAYVPMLDDCARRLGLRLLHRSGEPLAETAPVLAVLDLLSLFGSVWERRRVARALLNPYLDFGFGESPLDWLRDSGVADDRAGAGFAERAALDRAHPVAAGGGGGGEGRPAGAGSGADPVPADLCLRIHQAVEGLRALEGRLEREAGWEGFLRVFREALGLYRWGGEETLARARPAPGVRGSSRAPRVPAAPDGPAGRRAGEAGKALERDRLAVAAFLETLDSLGGALASSPDAPPASAAEFRKWLGIAMGEAYVPAPAEESEPAGRIRVHHYYGIHGASLDVLFLLGLNEKGFPTGRAEGTFWPSEFVEGFRGFRAGRSLWTSAAERSREEEEAAAAALGQAGRVFVMYPARRLDGKDALPSPIVESLLALWPGGGLRVEEMGRDVPPEAGLLAAPEELALHLLTLPEGRRAEALEAAGADPSAFPPPRAPRAAGGPRQRVPTGALLAWLASLPRHGGEPLVPFEALTSYAACPRAFWYGHLLGIRPVPEAGAEWSPRHQGELFHSVLRLFLRPLLAAGRPGGAGGPPPAGSLSEAALARIFDAEAAEAFRVVPTGRRPVYEAQRRRLREALLGWRSRQEDLEGRVIEGLEWGFGPSGAGDSPEDGAEGLPQVAPLRVESARGAFLLRGRVDRVDRLPGGGCLVVDYKMRYSQHFAPDENARKEAESWEPPDPAGDGPLHRPAGMSRAHFQLLLYRLAAGRDLGQPASARFEFLFAGKGGKYTAAAEEGGPEVLARLWENLLEGGIEPVAGGRNQMDCRNCDYQGICDRRPC